VNTQAALESDAMSVFTELLGHATSTIQAKAALDIMALRYVFCAFSPRGKFM